MNKTYVIKINSATATIQNVKVVSGQNQPTSIKVDGNVNVELLDTATGKAPHKISVRRVGKDLHVAFEGSDPAHSDLVLQDFYGENDNHLVGLAENGQYFEYIPTSGDGAFYVPLLSDGIDGIQALGGAELAGAAWAPMFASAFPIGAVFGAIGAVGLAGVAIAAAGGSHKVEPLSTPTQRPNSYLDNVGLVQNPNSTATLTDDTTPGLHIGALPSGATGAVLYVDGVIKPATYDPATGTLTPNSPLPDGVHTLGYGLTNSVGTTLSSPTLTLTVDATAPVAPVLHVADTDGNGKPNLTGTGEPGGLVTITDPSGVKHTTMVDPTGKFELEIDMPSKPLGEWIATVTDPADNISLPGKAIVTDLTAPTAPVAGVYDNVGSIQGLVPSKGVTDDATPTVSGTAEPGSVVTIMNDGKPVGSVVADSSGVWSFTLAPLVDGTYSVTTTATDKQGNTGPTSVPVVFTVDTLAPSATTASTLTDDVGRIQGPIVNGTITDDATPTFTGKAEAGATITVRDGGALQGTALVDAEGNWTYTSTTLAPGAHSFTATVSDPAGNISPVTTPIDFTVDLTVPTIAVNQVKDDIGTIIGTLRAGDVTDDNKPTVTGTATPGAVVKLYLDGTTTVIGTTVVDGTGQWSITPTTLLVDGKHDLTVTVTTVATGENPPTAPFSLTVDTTPPSPPALVSVDDNVGRIQGHVTAGVPSDDTTPLLTGKAEAGSIVKIFDGGQLIGTVVADGSGVWTLTPSPALVSGVHPITMTATDSAGTESTPSVPWNVVIDITAPTTPTLITKVVDDQGTSQGVVASGVGTIIDDAHPDFTGTAEADTTVIIKDGAVEIGTASVNASGTWTFTPLEPMRNGIHHVTASAMDTAGNIGPASSVFDFRLITGGVPTAPAITAVIDDVGTVSVIVPNGVTNDPTPTVEGTAVPGSTVKLYSEDGTLLGTTTSDAFGQWSITTLPLSEGAHSLIAKAVDPAGNLSAPTGPYPIVVDTHAPAVATALLLTDDVGPVVGAITNGITTDDATPTFSGKAEAGAKVTISDGTAELGTALVDPAGTWTFTSPHLENGPHTFSATVTDPAGNVSPATTPINFTLDASAVKISIDQVLDDVAPIAGVLAMNASTNDSTPTISGSATPGGTIKLYLDGTTTLIGTVTADSTGHWVMTPTAPLADGLHTLTATVTTAATGESLPTSAFTLTVDTVLPATPTIVSVYDNVGRIQGSVAAGVPSDDTTPRLTGKAEAGSTVAVFDGSVYMGATTTDASGNWTFTPVSPLNNGTHPITVTATDAAGNVSLPSLPWALLVDTIAPTVVPVITSVVDDQGASQGLLVNGINTDDARPDFTGTAGANTTVVIRDGTVELGTALTNAAGVWTFTPTALLFNGFHHVTASELDAAGNVGPASVPFDFRLISGGVPTAPAITNVIDDVGAITNVEPFGHTNDRTPTVEGTAVPGSIVSLFSEDSTLLGTTMADAKGQWSITTHSLTATATDTTGIPSAPTGPYQIVVDATLPQVAANPVLTDNVGTVVGPILDNGVTDDATPTFTGTAEAGATVSVKDNGLELGTALVDAAGNWTYTSPHLEPGLHAFTATVIDTAGNASAPTKPINFTLDTSTVAIAIDQVLDDFGPILGALAMSASTDDRNPTVSGTATAGGLVKLYLDGTTVPIGTATADSAGHWVITPVTSLANGLHNLTATVTTATAVESPATAAFALTVDSIAPSRPAILSAIDNVGSIQGTIPVGSVAPTDDTTPGLAGTADPGTIVTIFDAGQPIGTALVDAAGVWKFTPVSPLNDGTHPLTVKAADTAGNVSVASAPWNLLIDTTAPTIVPLITSVYDDQGTTVGNVANNPLGVTDDSLPLISGTSEPNGSVII
ncbi:Ig-like domain-containing protein, partial [Variovorax sp. RHLX14]|uniref:Ig-like domain-containing protein n=1 Tax=Variovorax sp. RHLX14 TaxID=1259731 RepID=UPI003F489CBB